MQATDDLLISLQDDDDLDLPLFQETPEPMTLMAAVRNIVSRYKGEFDINRIRDIIESEYPGVKRPLNPTSISNSLKRLHKDGILDIFREGRGKIPTVYKLSAEAHNRQEEEDFDVSFPPE